MTEADEVAETLIPAWFSGPQMGLRDWIAEALSGESQQLIDNVHESMTEKLKAYRLDDKLAHVWKLGSELGFKPGSILADMDLCENCGVLRGNKIYPETPCKGKVRVTTRSV